jgi:hypothetical protein
MDWGETNPGRACYPDVYLMEDTPASTTWIEGFRRFADFPSGRTSPCNHVEAVEQHLTDCGPCSSGSAMGEGCEVGEALWKVAFENGDCSRCGGTGGVPITSACPNIGRPKHGLTTYHCGRCGGANEMPESMETWLALHAALAAGRIGLMNLRKGRQDEPESLWPSRHRHVLQALNAGDAYAWDPSDLHLRTWSHAMVNLLPVPDWVVGPGHADSADIDQVIVNAAREFGADLVKAVACARVSEMVLENSWPRVYKPPVWHPETAAEREE